MVGYDLNKPRANDDYKNLIAALETYAQWWHYLDSTWIVKTDREAAQIRDHLKPYIDDGDELLVVRLSGNWASAGFTEKANTWLTNNVTYT